VVLDDQIFNYLDDIIRTQHIPVERFTKWWNIRRNTVLIDNPREVMQELVDRETMGGCIRLLLKKTPDHF
jgi:hypothetical protein